MQREIAYASDVNEACKRAEAEGGLDRLELYPEDLYAGVLNACGWTKVACGFKDSHAFLPLGHNKLSALRREGGVRRRPCFFTSQEPCVCSRLNGDFLLQPVPERMPIGSGSLVPFCSAVDSGLRMARKGSRRAARDASRGTVYRLHEGLKMSHLQRRVLVQHKVVARQKCLQPILAQRRSRRWSYLLENVLTTTIERLEPS